MAGTPQARRHRPLQFLENDYLQTAQVERYNTANPVVSGYGDLRPRSGTGFEEPMTNKIPGGTGDWTGNPNPIHAGTPMPARRNKQPGT